MHFEGIQFLEVQSGAHHLECNVMPFLSTHCKHIENAISNKNAKKIGPNKTAEEINQSLLFLSSLVEVAFETDGHLPLMRGVYADSCN